MALTERHHAFITACFYRELREHCPDACAATFILATQRYGEQRGSRMAQRAIRDGRELDFATYKAYGEWAYTEDYFACGKHMEVLEQSPDYHYLVHACPWRDQYQDMDLVDGARLYCRHIDLAIARGFNPFLTFEVRTTLHEGGRCDFVLKDARLDEKGFTVDPARARMPFDYHCGHVFTTFGDLVESIHGDAGKRIAARVREAFAAQYGEPQAAVLDRYRDMDFNVLP